MAPRSSPSNPIGYGVANFLGAFGQGIKDNAKSAQQERQKKAYYDFLKQLNKQKGEIAVKTQKPGSNANMIRELQFQENQLKTLEGRRKTDIDRAMRNINADLMTPEEKAAAQAQLEEHWNKKHPKEAPLLMNADVIRAKLRSNLSTDAFSGVEQEQPLNIAPDLMQDDDNAIKY